MTAEAPIAQTSSSTSPPAEPHGRHAVALELAMAEDGMMLVDWGCAYGDFAAILAQRFPRARVVACDIPYPHGAPALDATGAEYHVLDEERPMLPLPDASVDRVFLLDVLEHMGPDGPGEEHVGNQSHDLGAPMRQACGRG